MSRAGCFLLKQHSVQRVKQTRIPLLPYMSTVLSPAEIKFFSKQFSTKCEFHLLLLLRGTQGMK